MVLALMYSENKLENDVIPYKHQKMIFKTVFPLIAEVIEVLKSKDYKKLSNYLQKLEAELFLDKICKALVEQNIVPLTIHDSIIIEKSEREKAALIVKDILYDYFFVSPKFKVESIGSH